LDQLWIKYEQVVNVGLHKLISSSFDTSFRPSLKYRHGFIRPK